MGNALRAILDPAVDFLAVARDRLAEIAMTARVGIDFGKYLGPVRALGPGFDLALTTLISGAILAVILLGARAAFNLYLAFKSGVKWW